MYSRALPFRHGCSARSRLQSRKKPPPSPSFAARKFDDLDGCKWYEGIGQVVGSELQWGDRWGG
eukprot:13492287-Alexandrium_andersonii.AAC.1